MTAGSLSGEEACMISDTAGLITPRPSNVLLAQAQFTGGGGGNTAALTFTAVQDLFVVIRLETNGEPPKVRGQNRVRSSAEVPLPGEDKQREQPRCEEFPLSGKSISGHV